MSDNAEPITIKISNPTNLPLLDYRIAKPLQGDLKDLSEANYKRLKNVLIKRGFRVPLFIWKTSDTYYLMDGHQRQRVMMQENIQPYEVPVVYIEADNEAEARLQLLEISSQYGTITQEGFDEFTAELPEADLGDLYFDALFHDNIDDQDTEQDESPELDEANTDSKVGEIYALGKHRLMCGDSTDFGTMSDLMNGQLSDMVFTDPPYNVNWEYRGHLAGKGAPVFNDNHSPEDWKQFVVSFTQNMIEFMKDGAVYYMCSGYHSLAQFEAALAQFEAQPRQMIVWAKNQFVMGKHATDYHRQHEQIWYGWKSKNHQWYGGHKQSDLWQIDKVHNLNMVHSTEKPVAMPAKAIKNSSKEGDIILDLFAGSGSTLMACEQLNRTFYGMELDPKYCDVIRKRYVKFVTGSEDNWQEQTKDINNREAVEDANGSTTSEPAASVVA